MRSNDRNSDGCKSFRCWQTKMPPTRSASDARHEGWFVIVFILALVFFFFFFFAFMLACCQPAVTATVMLTTVDNDVAFMRRICPLFISNFENLCGRLLFGLACCHYQPCVLRPSYVGMRFSGTVPKSLALRRPWVTVMAAMDGHQGQWPAEE